MLTSLIVRIVDHSVRHPWRVIVAALLLTLASAGYVARHFAINTDISGLIDSNAPWARRDRALDRAFPGHSELTLAVVEAPAQELADQAANELAAQLARQPQLFQSVEQPGAGDFFTQNGLLFLSTAQLTDLTTKLADAGPLLRALARDPSLRGLSNLLSVTLLTPLQTGRLKLADMSTLLTRSADTVDAVLAHRPAALSWRALAEPQTANPTGGGRSFVTVHPALNFRDLEAGAAASNGIRRAAADLHLAERYGASVRLTGPRPLSDEEFASVADGAVVNAVVTLAVVLAILWFALRSARMVLAVFVTLLAGLAVTTALGLLMVGALNLISVAFAVLFVGIGVDFGIQFGVRYRDERHRLDNLRGALINAARAIALPLSLAAVATAASFLAFLPTAYRGISELGQIAGVGILCVAFPSSLTLLPALIAVLRPGGEAAPTGFRWLTPLDQMFERQRKPILIGTLALLIAGLPLLTHLRFDFNPLHLKNAQTESMATLRSLDPNDIGINDIKLLTASLADAQRAVVRLQALPEVGRVLSLASFVPADQPAKLTLIATLAGKLLPALTQQPVPPATDAMRVSALRNAALQLDNAALDHPGAGAPQARRLAASLRKLAAADGATRDRAERAIALPLTLALQRLRLSLAPAPISVQNLPPELVRNWQTPAGDALVQISPRVAPGADANDDTMLRRFTDAVLRAEPAAIGGPISILESARTIINAFIQATIYAVLVITVLLWLALRRVGDVLRTLIPLLVSAAATLELAVLAGISLNFANIIALPLLLGIGVAFKIYYVLAWRGGQTGLLQSGLTQAVVLSAATTGTAFGSLWLSHHPGTASMGELLALSLVCTLIGAVFFQPILMGRPRPPR